MSVGKFVWTKSCAQELFLRELFDANKIEKDAKAATVRSSYPIFEKVDPAVFRSHFNTIRNSLGYNRKYTNTII